MFLFFLITRRPPKSTLFPYPTLFRSDRRGRVGSAELGGSALRAFGVAVRNGHHVTLLGQRLGRRPSDTGCPADRSEEHTSELQSPVHLVCRLLLEKKKKQQTIDTLTL